MTCMVDTAGFKAELCVAIVRRRYVGKRPPRGETVENGALKLMDLSWSELFDLARKAGVRVPKQVKQRLLEGE